MPESPSEDALTDRTAQVRELLQELLRIPSINPPGGELPVARHLQAQWERAGFETQLDEFAPGRANLVGRRRWGLGPTLLLNGHMDVQPPGQGWTHDPFSADVEGDRIYGQGAEDMKAGLAAMTVAACNYARRDPQRGELVLTAVADEMSGGEQGSRRLVDQRLTADYAVVCEPTGADIYLAHRGALWLRLKVTGRSAHGGRPWLGVNAINVMTQWLAALQEWSPTTMRRRTHRLLPDRTLNIGSISGGHKINIVADQCVAEVDVRFLPGQDVTELVDAVQKMGASLAGAATVETEMIRLVEPMETEDDSPIVEVCREAYHAVTGSKLATGATAGFQDAHYFANDLQIATVMFGPFAAGAPGEDYPSRSGQPDEWVSLSSVGRTAHIYEEMIHGALER